MATNNTQAWHMLGLDSTTSDVKDTATERVAMPHVFQYTATGKRMCMHVHGGLACLHIPPDSKQTTDCCLRKFAASLEQTLNVASHSAKPIIEHNISLVSCMVADLLLRKTAMNKHFQPHELHISCALQLFADYKLCSVSSVHATVHRFRAQTKGIENDIKIRIRDIDCTEPHKSQLKISSPLIPASESSCYLTNSLVDHTWLKESEYSKLVSLEEVANWQMDVDVLAAITDECELGSSIGLVPSVTNKESIYTLMNLLEQAQIIRLSCDMAGADDTWKPDKTHDLIMHTEDDSYSDDDLDLIPQYDGASDKIADSHKKSDTGKLPATVSQNADCFQVSGDSKNQISGGDLNAAVTSDGAWRTGAVGRGLGNSQSYSPGSWPQQGWSQQPGSGSGSWHGHSQSWSQQQQYESWPQHQCLSSAFPPQQAPFQSPSPATSFQSPPNNPYASPSHQQTFQTTSQYHYPPYQSPPTSQSYQQPYQSPPHPYQSPRSSQTFHSSQPYNSSYQSTSANQSYQSLGTSNQSYQLPASNKPYPSATGNQCGAQSAGLPYQSPPSNHPFQQPTNVQTYPSPYQTSHSNQTSHPQSYQSAAHDLSQPSWSSQGYSGYNQSHLSSHSGPQSNPEQHLGESPQPQPGTLYGQPVNPISDGQGSFFPSQGLRQQSLTAKSTGTCDMSAPETQSKFGVSQVPQKRVYKKRKESKATGKLKKSSESPCMSPAPVVSKSPLESKSSSSGIPLLATETRYFQLQNDTTCQLGNTGDKTLVATSGNTSPVTKMSTFEFKPDIVSFSSLNTEPSTGRCMELLNSAPRIKTEKADKITTTPMIQQLLMEEPIRMNIKKEDRDAVMKKPMGSPTPPKPKRKYKTRVKQTVKTPKRPRSTSLSSPVPPMMGYCGYSPQPIMNPPMIGRPGRSHSISLPFSCESRMPSPIHNYGWQQWKPHNLPSSNEWQEQQHQWGINDRQNFASSGEPSCSPAELNKTELMPNMLQHTSIGVNAVQSPVCSQNLQPSQSPSLFHSQNAIQQSSLQIPYSSSHTYSNRENVSDKSSLSSLFQLISDVGSDDTGWENESVSIPNLFSNSSDSETHNISMSVPDVNQGSPSAKDFITLETPCKQGCQKAYSDTTAVTSSEESDRMDFDLASDLKSRTVSRNNSLGSIHPRVGKQNRLKKLGILQTRTKLVSTGYFMDTNPSYTYTFHVPTTLFKKLKFFRSAENRKHIVNVVRMHPMDARRYSLMKIGREIVKVTKLTDADLASYNVTLPPAHFTSADGCTNRVNLDIPIVRADKQADDSGEKIIFSQFDTDFPPNKVAPPSSFCASQMSISVSRTSSPASSRSSVGSNRMQQYTGRQPANYNGGISPVSQQGFGSQEGNFNCAQQQDDLQPLSQVNINRQSGSQLSEDNSSTLFHQLNQKTNSSYSYLTPSSTEDNRYTNQQGVYMNPQQDQQQYQLQQDQQQQAGSSGCHPEPKNGLRSLGQHGLTSGIENGRADDISGDQEVEVYDSTTKSSLFNTQVNAQLWDNHAEHMANCTGAHAGACTSQQQLTDLGKHIDPNQLGKNEDICQKRQKTIKASRAIPCHYSPAEDTLSENSHEDHNGEVTDSKCASDNSDDVPQNSAQLTTLETHTTDTSMILQPDKCRGSLCWRKNRKALSLTIPKYSDLNLLHLERAHNSSGYMERALSSNFQKELGEGDFIGSIDASALRRSTRSYTLEGVRSEVGGKHSTRQAKLRSVYFKSPHNLKPKKRRKRQGPLIEGVHYIVVGKFKGHQSMLVKIKKLNVKPTEIFVADYFEEIATKDIVRLISPMTSSKDGMDDGKCEGNNYLDSTTESKSDTETCDLHLGIGNHEFDQNGIVGSRSTPQNASRGRSLRHGKFRSAMQQAKFGSAHDSTSNQGDALLDKSQTGSPRSKGKPKNVMAGPGGASENNVLSPYFVEDKFFYKFKESFIRNYRVREQAVDSELNDHENIFFEGIRRCSFQSFQQKFISNVQKLTSDDYSSSSDDEDDVLDSTILKEQIDTTDTLEVSQVTTEVTQDKLVKQGYSMAKSDSWTDQPFVSQSFSHHVSENRFKIGSSISENSLPNEWACTKEQTCYVAKDHEVTSTYNGTLWRSIGWMNNSQEKIDNRRPFLKANNNMDCEVSSKLEQKNMKDLMVEDSKIHCFENPSLCSVTDSSTIKKDGEDNGGYLKCQMAFFEDISSDSDSNDTVITDSYIEKDNIFTGFQLHPDQFATKTATNGENTHDNNDLAVSNVQDSSKDIVHNEIFNSDLRNDCDELSQVNGSNHKLEASINFNNSGGTSQIVDKCLARVSVGPAPEFHKESGTDIFKLIEQQKDASLVGVNSLLPADHTQVSEIETVELDTGVSAPTLNSVKCSKVDLSMSLVTENKIMDLLLDSEHNTEARMFEDLNRRPSRQGKRVKKSVRNRKSKLHKRKQSMADGQYSCDDEANVALESGISAQKKCFDQRRKTCYAYQTIELNSTDSSGDESVSQHKSSKNYRKSKVGGSKDAQVRSLPEVSVNIGRGTRGRPARGRRKKQTGGDKLLNCLSLLHMATLANLTETQTEPGEDQLLLETLTQAENEKHSCHHSDRFNHDNTTSSAQDQIFSVSPKNSTVQSASAGKRRITRRCAKEDITLSTKLLDFSQKNLTNSKPECSGTANLGSKPPAFNRIVNNSTSSSPIPSNITFNHSTDSNQPEAANQAEDAVPYNTLQLLETRRAQVNCASFSMKDILKLTTPDDSMDFDSKSNAPLLRPPPEPQRAQVKITPLCRSDILKLTSIDASSEHASSIISLLSNSNSCKAQPFHNNQVSPPNTQTLSETISTCNVLSQSPDSISCQVQEETSEASDSLLSQLAKFNRPPSQLSIETTEASQSLLSNSAIFDNSLPEKCSDATSVKSTSYLMKQKITELKSSPGIGKRAPLNTISISDFVQVNTNIDSNKTDSDTNKNPCSGNMKSKHPDFSECITTHVRGSKECHQSTDISIKPSVSITLASSPGPSNSPNIKCLSVPPDPSCSLVTETCTSSDLQNLSRQQLGGLDRTSFTPTTGTIVQTAGVKNASMSCVEESEKPHFDSHSTIPSQVPLQSNIPETPVSAEIEIEGISTNSDEKSINEKLSFSIPRPQSLIPKQENRGNHKNLKVRNAYRGLKPLHPLQIPPYSYVDHGLNSQWEQVLHNARSSSVYYPYCWQWPAYTPGSDPAVSPLNLCITQKSPNNYSPITPTSPISPNYPTQAQGATESDLSSPVKTGKPLWYPWLKVDVAKPETKLDSPGYQHKHHHKVNIKTSSTFPVMVKDNEQTSDNLCREAAQTGPCKDKHDARLISELHTNSPGRFKGQFSFTRPASLKLDSISSSCKTAFNLLERANELGSENLPSTSCSGEASLGAVPEKSNFISFDAKQSSIKNGGCCSISDSVYWIRDASEAPDSLESYQSNSSSSKSCVSHINENIHVTTEVAENKSIFGFEQGERLKFKYERKPRGKFRLSTLVNQPSQSSLCGSEQIGPTDCIETKHVKTVDKLESYHQKNVENSGSSKTPTSSQKRSTKMLNQSRHTRNYP